MAKKLSFFELYIAKPNVIAFSWLKHVALSFIAEKKVFWSVCRKVVCFAVILHRKKVFFQFAASPPNFSLILLKQRFSLCLAKLRCSRILLLRTTFSSSFVSKLHIWRSILPEKCFGLLATKLGCFEPYVTKKRRFFSLLCLKYVAFSFVARRTCFRLFAVTVGCSQRYCNGKRFSPSLQRVTLIFTWFYSTKRFRLFPARLRCFNDMCLRKGFSFLPYQNCAFDLLSYLHEIRFWRSNLSKRCFGALAGNWGYFELVRTGKPSVESNVYSLFYLVNKVSGRLKPKTMTCIKRGCWSYLK